MSLSLDASPSDSVTMALLAKSATSRLVIELPVPFASMVLFVSVSVLDIVGTLTHSTAILPADTRDIVVSVACQSSIVLICGAVARTSQPVPVDVAPPRVFTISPTVASSNTVAAALVIVVESGTVSVLIPESEVTSESIKAPAAWTFVASVTSAKASIPANLDMSPAVVNLLVVEVSSMSSASSTTLPV